MRYARFFFLRTRKIWNDLPSAVLVPQVSMGSSDLPSDYILLIRKEITISRSIDFNINFTRKIGTWCRVAENTHREEEEEEEE
ncbi:hypothetical protein evm_008453 [Chilo suppressalis]|nr:hypothetical protein evm_008453 [Chilo suppressalis]